MKLRFDVLVLRVGRVVGRFLMWVFWRVFLGLRLRLFVFLVISV